MQNGIGTLFHSLRSDYAGGRSKQREQFGCSTTHVFMRPTCRITLGLEGRTRLRDALIRAAFILAPDLEAESLTSDIGPLNYRFFSGVSGSYRSSTPFLVLRRVKPVLHHVRFLCQV